MRVHDSADDRQPEPEASMRPRPRALDLYERLQHTRALVRRNPRPIVPDVDEDAASGHRRVAAQRPALADRRRRARRARVAQNVLQDYGAEVVTAASADAGLELLGEQLDVLLSDIGMPRKDGYDFIRDDRRGGHRLPAAALTAFARSEDRTGALLYGYRAHVKKPVEPAELLATVVSLTSEKGRRLRLRARHLRAIRHN